MKNPIRLCINPNLLIYQLFTSYDKPKPFCSNHQLMTITSCNKFAATINNDNFCNKNTDLNGKLINAELQALVIPSSPSLTYPSQKASTDENIQFKNSNRLCFQYRRYVYLYSTNSTGTSQLLASNTVNNNKEDNRWSDIEANPPYD